MKTVCCCVVFLLSLSSALHAKTWNVPGDFPNIQAAINGASNGDLILVAPGTYSEKINFIGKSVEVRSTGGASVTSISAPSAGSVVTFSSGESRSSILSGFTVTNGTGTNLSGTSTFGGGVLANGASPTIKNCRVFSNTAKGTNIFSPSGSGGGMYLLTSSALIENSSVVNNQATNDGGGIWASSSGALEVRGCTIESNICTGTCGGGLCVSGVATIESNRIAGNIFPSSGGGISCGSGCVVRNNAIEENSSLISGGGIQCSGGAVIESNAITGNVTGLLFGDGGGIFCSSGAPRIAGNVIADNVVSSGASTGGGIAGSASSPIIVSNVVVDNRSQAGGSTAYGGGLSFIGGSPVLTNNTIANNFGQDGGGGLSLFGGCTATITNCIVWGNTIDPQIAVFSGSAVVTYSDVQGGFAGSGNIDQDPLFVNSGGGDYHLLANTTCFDVGSDTAPQIPASDFEGDARIHYDHVDMGADEISGCVVVMKEFGVGLVGSGGFVPHLYGTGRSCNAGGHAIHVEKALGKALSTLWVGVGTKDYFPFYGGHFYIDLGKPFVLFNFLLSGPKDVPGAGFIDISGADVNAFQGLTLYLQFSILDPGAIRNVSLTNAVSFQIGE